MATVVEVRRERGVGEGVCGRVVEVGPNPNFQNNQAKAFSDKAYEPKPQKI